jgi:hypothetical protein
MLQGSPCMFTYPDTAKRRPPTWMVADLGLVLGLIIVAFLGVRRSHAPCPVSLR